MTAASNAVRNLRVQNDKNPALVQTSGVIDLTYRSGVACVHSFCSRERGDRAVESRRVSPRISNRTAFHLSCQ